ncbi:hypothetical protein [Ornithinimicrobium panacihumi]|uniref:hypothetical protein n=1 Tax=Ornithinimicrobium panacihumi TaxID=2008449 RepID=UPI003F89BC04
MRILRLTMAIGLTAALAACGSVGAPGSDTTTDAPEDGAALTGPAVVDLEDELAAHGMIMQRSADAEPELCVGGVAESYPPQCGGPVLAGDFSWEGLDAEEEGEVRWTNDAYWAVGHLDLSTGGQGTFTLSRPLTSEQPEGITVPPHDEDPFPQLCDDPTADVPDVDQAARTSDGTGMAEEQELIAVASGLEGYVLAYLSDGGPTMNVLINEDGDLKAARTALRAVFHGPLCLEQRDLPSEADVAAAQDALSKRFQELRLLSSGGGGTSGILEVQALVADTTTVEAIHETVAPWLDTAQVSITSAFRSVEQGG